jgi:hypothetical protein
MKNKDKEFAMFAWIKRYGPENAAPVPKQVA